MKKLFNNFVELVRSDWRDGKNAAEHGEFEASLFYFILATFSVFAVTLISLLLVAIVVEMFVHPVFLLAISIVLGIPTLVLWLIVRKS